MMSGKGKGRGKMAAGAGVILALGILFGMLGPFGLGSGSGTPGVESSSETLATTDGSGAAVAAPERRTTDGPADKITVLIDGHDYFQVLNVGGKPVQRAKSLDDLLNEVKLVPGDDDGVRIRILRKDSARASAENALLAALESNGIGTDAVYMPDAFVE